MKFAEREVSDAEMRVMSTQTAITAFRNREMMIDPKQTSTAMLELIGRLSDDLAATRTRREELLTSAPQSAEIGPLDSRVTGLQHQIDDERAKMVGQDASVAPRIAEYEQLVLARDFAEKALDIRLRRPRLQREPRRAASSSILNSSSNLTSPTRRRSRKVSRIF